MLFDITYQMVKNRGTGAGGAKTTMNGTEFEKEVGIFNKLKIEYGFVSKKLKINGKPVISIKKRKKECEYLELCMGDFRVVFAEQYDAKCYINNKHPSEHKFRYRPDGVFFWYKNDRLETVKIIEIKNQNGGGSIDLKILAGYGMKWMYNYYFNGTNTTNIDTDYALFLSDFILGKTYVKPDWKKFLQKHEIHVYSQECEDEMYFWTLPKVAKLYFSE